MALTKIIAPGITDGIISTAKIADGNISTAKIADDAVTAAKTGFSLGKIGQVKTVKINSNATESGSGSQGVKTNSTSYVDVGGLTLAITPSATSSTILAMYHAQHSNTDAGTDVSWSQIRMLRGSTTVSESTRAAGYMKLNHDMWSMSIIDSPSTVSEITYKIQIASGSSDVHFSCPHFVNECAITLMEILA